MNKQKLTELIMSEFECFYAFDGITKNQWNDLKENITKFVEEYDVEF